MAERDRQNNEGLLALIDVDRCVLNTEYFFKMSIATIETMGVSSDTINEVITLEAQNRGNAFDFIAELEQRCPELELSVSHIMEKMLAQYSDIKAFRSKILANGALEFIETVRHTGAQGIFLTAGGIKTQTLKLTVVTVLLGREAALPWIIIRNSDQRKTELALEAYDENTHLFDYATLLRYAVASSGVKQLESARVDDVMVFDDKVQNVRPVGSSHVTGILIQRAEFPSDEGDYIDLSTAAERLRVHNTNNNM